MSRGLGDVYKRQNPATGADGSGCALDGTAKQCYNAVVLTEMNRLLERVGNLSEKYSSKWIDWLPDFSLLVALKWVMLVLILGTAALAGWYGAAAIRGLFL